MGLPRSNLQTPTWRALYSKLSVMLERKERDEG